MSASVSALSLYRADNPLINPPALPHGAPALDIIKPEHYRPAVAWAIAKVREEVEAIKKNPEAPTFKNTVEALALSGSDKRRVQLVFDNMSMSNNTEELQAIENDVRTELSRISTELETDSDLFVRVKAVYETRDTLSLSQEQSMLLSETYKEFVRSGVDLPPEKKARLKAVEEKISEATTQFKNNSLNATAAFRRIVSEAELDGVPERARAIYREHARRERIEGEYLLLLEPVPEDIIIFCRNRALREDVYKAIQSTAFKDAFDNTGVIKEIIKYRHEKARLLGWETFADYTLSDRMAGSVETVKKFLENNREVYKPVAEAELNDLKAFAFERDGITDLKPWDMLYYTNLLKEKTLGFKSEELRPYFELEHVLEGLRMHAEKLFNIEIREEKTGKYPVHHPDVRTFEIFDNKTRAQIGILYGDYYAREHKEGGAWAHVFRQRGIENGENKFAIAINNSNFAKPSGGRPTLLSMRDVKEMFHEFGHWIHVLLSEVDYPRLSGGEVKWDFVELPSRLMENWAIQRQVLDTFARHHETGALLPPDLLQKLKTSENFHIATKQLTQNFYGYLDLGYYATDPANIKSVETFERDLGKQVLVADRVHGLMSTHFLHIFSSVLGGYAAGFYSYKWVEVMDADVFEAFLEKGLYDQKLCARLREMYSKGASVDPTELYVFMMGRLPDPDASFRREGLMPALPAPQADRAEALFPGRVPF